MNISGVLIHSRPAKIGSVKALLAKMPGVEVHAETEDCRLIVTVEDKSDSLLADTVVRLQNLDGVLSAAMIYHQYEDDPRDRQEASP